MQRPGNLVRLSPFPPPVVLSIAAEYYYLLVGMGRGQPPVHHQSELALERYLITAQRASISGTPIAWAGFLQPLI